MRKLKDYLESETMDLPKGAFIPCDSTPQGWEFYGYLHPDNSIRQEPGGTRLIQYVGEVESPA